MNDIIYDFDCFINCNTNTTKLLLDEVESLKWQMQVRTRPTHEYKRVISIKQGDGSITQLLGCFPLKYEKQDNGKYELLITFDKIIKNVTIPVNINFAGNVGV
jgi:hypothetical protein